MTRELHRLIFCKGLEANEHNSEGELELPCFALFTDFYFLKVKFSQTVESGLIEM